MIEMELEEFTKKLHKAKAAFELSKEFAEKEMPKFAESFEATGYELLEEIGLHATEES
jgi:hypothetical protein